MDRKPTIDLGAYHVDRSRLRAAADPLQTDPGRSPGQPGAEDRSGPAGAESAWPVWWHRAGSRRVVLAVLAGLILIPLIGTAAGPAPPLLAPAWSLPAGATDYLQALGERDLYRAEPAGREWTLTAYRLSDGQPRWQAPLGRSPEDGWFELRVSGGVPYVTATRDWHGATTAIDPATGRERWTRPGSPIATVTGGRVLLRRTAGPVNRIGLRPYDVAALDPVTGDQLWSVHIHAGEQVLFGQEEFVAGDPALGDPVPESGSAGGAGDAPSAGLGPTQMITLRRDGVLTRYELTTGASTSTTTDLSADQQNLVVLRDNLPPELAGRLRWLVSGVHPLFFSRVGDGLVLFSRRDQQRREVVSYDAGTLAPEWRSQGYSWASWCRPMICVATEPGATPVTGVDPDTGRIQWSRDCDGADLPTGHCHQLPMPLAPELLLVELWATSRPGGPFVGGVHVGSEIIHSGTGQRLLDLDKWRIAAGSDGGQVLLRWSGPTTDQQPTDQRSVAGTELTLARLSVDPPRMEVLGTVAADECALSAGTERFEFDPDYLVCWSADGGAQVWRVG